MFFLILLILKLIYCEYSSFEFNDELVKQSGNYWLTANNVCFYNFGNLYTNVYFSSINYIEYNKIIYKFYDYMYSYNFVPEIMQENLSYEYNDEEVWLTSSWLNDNICHFLDNMFLYNIQNDNKYPPINHLNIADLNPQTTLPYNNMMLKMMINNYNKPFKISFQPEMSKLFRKSKDYILCYKRVHIYIRSLNRAFSAVFRNYQIGRRYRDEGYKYLKVNIGFENNNEISITIINRKIKARSRSITNLKMIKEMIKCMGYTYNEIYFEDKNPKEQIESIMNSKIIITPFGSGTTNILWLISSKSLIIDCMSTYVMMDYSYYSYSLNYKYIPLFSLFHNINPNSFDDGYDEIYKFENQPSSVLAVHFIGFYPLFKTSGNDMTISLRQIQFSLKYSFKYIFN